MSRVRVIPRDLFNEANLLKCYGQMYLNLERLRLEDCLQHDGGRFRILESDDDGSLTVVNVRLVVTGREVRLSRPLNSRDAYPLHAHPDDVTELAVFTADGSFTPDMLEFLLAVNP